MPCLLRFIHAEAPSKVHGRWCFGHRSKHAYSDRVGLSSSSQRWSTSHLLQCQLGMVVTYHDVGLFSVELRHTDWKGMVHAVDVLPKDSDTHYFLSIEQSSSQTSRLRVECTSSFFQSSSVMIYEKVRRRHEPLMSMRRR